MVTAVEEALSEELYHADAGDGPPSLSSSIAKLLIEKSPKHAYQAHPRLGGLPHEASKEMDQGTLIHKLVLGTGPEVVIVDAPDWRTNAAKAARDQARAEGKLPVLAEKYAEAVKAAEAITDELFYFGIHLSGKSELTVRWVSRHGGYSVPCRGRLDHLVIDRDSATIIDIKTSRSAHPAACTRTILNFGYDIQRAAYVEAVEEAYPQAEGRVRFLFVFAELEPFVSVTPGVLDGVMEERGRRRWSRAVQTWARCMEANLWPSYVERMTTFESPGWLISQMEEEQYDEQD